MNDLSTQIEYRVICEKEDVKMHISYTDDKGQPFAVQALSGWTYSLATEKLPYTVILHVTNISTEVGKMKVSLEILVNGKVVMLKSGIIGTKAKQDVIAQYVVRN